MNSPRSRCRFLRLAPFLLLGAFTTAVSVFFGAAWAYRNGGMTMKVQLASDSAARLAWLWPPPQRWPATPDESHESSKLGYTLRYCFESTDTRLNEDNEGRQREETAGFPFRCTRHRDPAEYAIGHEPLFQITPLTIPPKLAMLNGGQYSIPLTPLWPGLLANIAIWSSAWWLLLAGPGALQRSRRRATGRCAACGYELAGLAVCPECGTTTTPKPS